MKRIRLAALFCITISAFSQPQPMAPPGGSGGGRGRGPTPKNLKVLAPQEVNPYMQMSVIGLGVAQNGGPGCLYCHVSNEARDLDDKQEKVTARKMMQMVKDVNANVFAGEQKVVCWTCHRGEVKPAAAPAPAGRGFGGRGPGTAPPPAPPQ